ncbi:MULTISPECIES: putative quinol monooxygenase [Flavobacteriaceae]|uniref:Antibiotic biosynthesis monooxygenase n=4 Tax=Flavobacteriaceae TaxID=49546 RepID=A0A0Q9ZJV8_9FLAO|nr:MULTISPECIES: antibiotic biosynthesis monooxygenase [Flavobacteriaceae]APS40732.1 antibiotic biosynthesis monooxygenase [Salegentibacter sp. T436]KRG28648.1 antibiotic biosynthesis monooxygenase [Salegentibacter mishustinae]MBO2544069.1 antibiotic biosynthesis monooxygenase [Salegentibacter sp. BDJ18]MDT0641394.1 antibiotic biosynthesis monooxygenase [Zunongwangia sp. F363]PNW22779.1 antibiotic biosynthesis monooxygenase [Salegentibacter mishustinae]
MKSLKIQLAFLTIILCFSSCKENNVSKDAFSSKEMLIRIAELEIYPEYIEEYKEILKEEAEASVRVEPGVVSIFPMYQTENPNQIRILEIYADKKAYESHLEAPHFQYYKTNTQRMVKSLKLIDMKAIDEESMPEIFKKIDGHN